MLRASIMSTLQKVDNIFNRYDTLTLWSINAMFTLIIAGYYYPPMVLVVVPTFATLSVVWFTIFLSSLTRGR